MVELGKQYQVNLIATNDVHYVDRQDARYQDILLAIKPGRFLADQNRMHMNGDTYIYVRRKSDCHFLVKFRDLLVILCDCRTM
jgi:DNA polymerase III alpha subunit